MKSKKFLGTLDRIEGDRAVILAGEDEGTVDISRSLLPETAKENDILSIRIDVKDKATAKAKEKVAEQIRKLAGN